MDTYEKKYKEALEKARQLCAYPTTKPFISDLQDLFPELTESNDERIRKELIDAILGLWDNDALPMPLSVKRKDEWIAWLEKQGEPQDKGEISDGYHTFNELYYYRMLYNAAFFNMLPKEWVHKSKKHHDGEDCFGGGWFIVMANLPTGQISNHYELKDWDLFQIPEKEVADKWDGHTPQEAADRLHKYLLEKQDKQPSAIRWYDVSLIPQEMEELLVEWDSEDATWHEIAFYHADTKTFWNGTRQVENVTRWCYITDLLEKQGNKTAWSDEDEERIKNILSVLDVQVCWNGATGKKENPYQKEINWLKFLKDRAQPQPKQEWSEENDDDAWMNDIISKVENNLQLNKAEIDFLKSLKDRVKSQNTWKPSDKQMRALEYIINNAHNTSYSCKIAKELLEQLRKLKGE